MRLGGSRIRSCAKSNDHRFFDHSVTIAFLFGVSCNKQFIVKSYLQLDKNLLTL